MNIYNKNKTNYLFLFGMYGGKSNNKLYTDDNCLNNNRQSNNKLYTDDNPKTTIKGTGFVNKKKAIKTIDLIKKRSISYQKSVIITMLNRAKYHKNITDDMKEAIKVFNKWLIKNKNKKRKYEYLDIKVVKRFEKLAKEYGVSEVSRGIKKASRSDKGFLVMYKKFNGNKQKLSFTPVKKNNPSGQDYDSMRETFINSRLGQMKKAKTKLYYTSGKYKGMPTKQHIILIMYAYSPEPNVIKKIKL
jgi:hypothetical protein